MSDLSPETEELLSRGREGTSMSRARRDEIKSAVLAKLTTGAILTTSTSAAAWTATTKVIGLAVLAVVVGAGSVGVVKYQAHARASQSTTTSTTVIANPTAQISPATAPSAVIASAPLDVAAGNESPQTLPQIQPPVAIADPITTAIANPVVAVANPPTSQNSLNLPAIVNAPSNALSGSSAGNSPENSSANHFPTSANATAPVAATSHPSSLEEETTLLRAAHDAIAADDPARALRLLDEHAARFPNSALEPERSAERVFAYCAEKNTAYAHAAAGSFLAAHPTGPLATRVRSSCGNR